MGYECYEGCSVRGGVLGGYVGWCSAFQVLECRVWLWVMGRICLGLGSVGKMGWLAYSRCVFALSSDERDEAGTA